uniref:Uncharacterized protein n=1 Tax=Ixodes ricinus TaxID=34613 RepID=A0A147BQJ1_IXORI
MRTARKGCLQSTPAFAVATSRRFMFLFVHFLFVCEYKSADWLSMLSCRLCATQSERLGVGVSGMVRFTGKLVCLPM